MKNNNIKTFHLAEGPGGFIEAIVRERQNRNDIYCGMTLMENDIDIPKWNKITNLMKENHNIKLVFGPKNDGNLYFKHNLDFICTNITKTQCTLSREMVDLITVSISTNKRKILLI